jgi:hypothetical protein
MAVSGPTLQRRIFVKFDGGLNLRDAPGEVSDNESPDMMNVTLDERGGIVKRLGTQRDNSASINNSTPWNLFYSEALDQLILQIGTKLYKRTSSNAYTEITRAGPLAAFTTSALVGMADLAGILYVVHPADGVLKYTGSGSLTSVNTTVLGNALATWQNKLWATGVSNTVWWSNAGNGDTWTTASDFVQIRDVNDDVCTAIGFGQALDQGAVPAAGLLVAKRGSLHRINDSATGAYRTLSAEAGAAGSRALAHLNGLTMMVNDKGVWVTDGEEAPQLVSERLRPLFTPEGLSMANLSNTACGIHRDRFIISLTQAGATTNDLTLEYQPVQGWYCAHSFAMAAYATLRQTDSQLFGLTTATDPNLIKVFTGGVDNKLSNGTGGTAITCRFQTRWFEPVNGGLVRIRRLRIQHRGSFNILSRRDFEAGEGELLALTPADELSGTALYGTAVYGTDAYGAAAGGLERYTDIYSLGVAKAWAFELQQTGSLSFTAPRLLETGAAPEVGEVALYELHIDFVPLGYA